MQFKVPGDDEVYDLVTSKFTFGEAKAVEKSTGLTMSQIGSLGENAQPTEVMQAMFWISMKLPEGDPGTTVAFPVVQTCEQGQTDWIEPVVEGQDEPEHPAPVITLTAAEGDEHATTTTLAGGEDGTVEDAAVELDGAGTEDDSSSSNALSIGALVLGALGLATGGLALARSGRKACRTIRLLV